MRLVLNNCIYIYIYIYIYILCIAYITYIRHRLEHWVGFSGAVIKLSKLQDRSLFGAIGNYTSTPTSLTCGVPQGSILGPLLFNRYMLLLGQIITERKYPDSLLIILGDFNQAKLSRELPKHRQHIKCPTRNKNTLDHCYTTLKKAYRSVPRAALGLSAHCLVHFLPSYRQKLKSAKPVVKTVRKWTNESKPAL